MEGESVYDRRRNLSDVNQPSLKKSNWKGFTLQLFLITILPLTALLLIVAFGSQTLHHEAMRSLVGDRDLRTVRATSSSLDAKSPTSPAPSASSHAAWAIKRTYPT